MEKIIEEGTTFADLEKNSKAFWSLLLFSGYLSIGATPVYGTPCQLRIPNMEVKELYHSIILKWFEETIREPNYQTLLQSLITGDVATFSQIFQEFLLSSFSFFDVSTEEPEKIYHAFILGVLIGLKDQYEVKSNRESGYGRYDVMLIPKNLQDLGVVMEFKKIGRFEESDLETAVASALKQVKDRKYDLELKNREVKRILHLGLAFKGKHVMIRSNQPSSG